MNGERVERLTRAVEAHRFTSDVPLSQPVMNAAVAAVLRAILEDRYRASEILAALQEYPAAGFQVERVLAELNSNCPVSVLPDP